MTRFEVENAYAEVGNAYDGQAADVTRVWVEQLRSGDSTQTTSGPWFERSGEAPIQR